jgi:hypothetical protein
MVNSTDITVFIDGNPLTPPPFPIITTNGTYYFIYFEFTLSTHEIAIRFAPVHDVAVTSVACSKRVVAEGQSFNVTVTVWNEGSYTETFNVTLYGEMLWGWENDTFPLYVFTGVTLTPGSSRTLTASITLPAFPWGIYVLKACAGPVPGQTRVSDLVCTRGSISVFSPKIHARGLFYGRCGWFGFMPL